LTIRTFRQRAVAVAVIAVLNAAWFFSIGCAALCAFGPCPQKRAPVADGQCHHSGQIPLPRQHHQSPQSPCPDHVYPVASLVPASAPDITPGLQSGTLLAGFIFLVGSTDTQFVPICDTPSHSPPGLSTGRVLLQKESLLRI
jgi:hypothetical protein